MKKSITLIIAFILFIGNFNIINAQTVDNTDEEGGVYDSGNSEDWNDNDEALYDDAAKYGIDSKLADQ